MVTKKDTATVPEAIDFDANGWRPAPGDILEGTLVDITTGGTGVGSFGRYAILTVRKADGREVAVHAFHHTLKERLREMRPKVGHELKISFLGTQEQVDKDGKPKLGDDGSPKTLTLYSVESPDFEFDWDRL